MGIVTRLGYTLNSSGSPMLEIRYNKSKQPISVLSERLNAVYLPQSQVLFSTRES